ncbi:MFS transporter [Roseibium sp. RKSG952]|uniref:MFS transporter n=1 Tax=Roseibium sp. RKSG952 TaxID=2529384 RepID=UPI0018AD21E3|nr:MFS transporter [Roseibium sp. RKSG952]
MQDTGTGRRQLVAGAAGNTLEWYDFAVYAYLVPVIADQFFPSKDPIANLLSAFGVFAVGYLMRPIGGWLLGHVADLAGRRIAMIYSILLMAVTTVLIGLLPNYDSIGFWAPLALIVLRLGQGLAVGGELPSSAVFLYENVPPRNRAFGTGLVIAGAVFGMLLGSASIAVVSWFVTAQEMALWGWRIPFLMGVLLAVVCLFLRAGLEEKGGQGKNRHAGHERPVPIKAVFLHHKKGLLIVLACNCLISVTFYMVAVFINTYLVHFVGQSTEAASTINTVSLGIFIVLVLVFARVADAIGRKRVLLFGAGAQLLLAIPIFLLLSQPVFWGQLAGQVGLAAIAASQLASSIPVLISQFPKSDRVTGFSLGYTIPAGVFGGTVPLLMTYFMSLTGWQAFPALYLMLLAVIVLPIMFVMPDKSFEKGI